MSEINGVRSDFGGDETASSVAAAAWSSNSSTKWCVAGQLRDQRQRRPAARSVEFGPDGSLPVASLNTDIIERQRGVNGAPLGDFVTAGAADWRSKFLPLRRPGI
jgi:hypothetical protein